MADITLQAVTPLNGYELQIGDTRLAAIEDLDILSIAQPYSVPEASSADTRSGLDSRLQEVFGLHLPEPGYRSSKDEDRALLGLQPGQWFMTTTHRTVDPLRTLKSILSDSAYMTDQSDSWTVLELHGPLAQAALERICPLDLAVDSFDDKQVARTVMEHLSVILERPAPTRFRLYSPRSSAQSFLHAVSLSLHNVS